MWYNKKKRINNLRKIPKGTYYMTDSIGAAKKQYFEIVNWLKAQPRMNGEHQEWCKLYTSILHNDQFISLDDASRCLIIHLWVYAAYTGRYVFPADPDWLWKRIPSLNSRPNLQPLFNAKDSYGQANPFIRYCDPQVVLAAAKPATRQPAAANATSKEQSKITAQKTKKTEKTRQEQIRADKSREEQTPPHGLHGSVKEDINLRVSTAQNQKEQSKPKQSSQQQNSQSADEPKAEQMVKPATTPQNPMESEVRGAAGHIIPKPPCSAYHSPQRIGSIIADRFPDHWQDSDAESFGWEMVKALGMPIDKFNLRLRSEWGSFAAWWCRIKKSVPISLHNELKVIALRKAEYVRRKAKTAKNHSAVWFAIMDKELASHGISLPPTRASPQSIANM
jgi:hypothetical protein